MIGNIHKVGDKMQKTEYSSSSDRSPALNTLRAEIKQIFQTAKEEAINTVANIFENAQMKAEASIQNTVSLNQLNSNVEQSDISADLTKMDLIDLERGSHGNRVPDISLQSSEESEITHEDIENSQESAIRDNLDRFELYISDCVKATDLIAFFGLFSSAQTKELRCINKRNPVEASKMAFKMVKTIKSQPNKYRLLLEALTDAGYPKIVQILNGTLIPVGSCHRNIIRQCANHIFQRLNASDILPYLYSKSVISSDDKQQILQTERAESTGIAALELLDMLPNRNKRWFKYFIESLLQSGHEDLAIIINDNTNYSHQEMETPNDNMIGISSTGLKLTGNNKEEPDNSTMEMNSPVMSLTHGINVISAASSFTESPTSCVEATQFNLALSTDHTTNVKQPEMH